MKAFRFTLQAILTLRQRQEQVCLEQYGQAVQAREQALARLEAVQAELESAWAHRRALQTAGAPLARLIQADDWCQTVDARRTACAAALREAQSQVAAAWSRFLAARRQREGVEKYRARQKRRYDLDCQREEQRILDDLNTSRFAGEAPSLLISDYPLN